MLLDFLRNTRSDYLYLVGDIIDGWRLKNKWFWPQEHNDVVQKILRKARHGTKVYYVSGNHDELVRKFVPINLGEVNIVNEAIHITADNKKLLILHGDKFDAIIRVAPWLAHLGDYAYDFALWTNVTLNKIRKRLGYKYWSLSKFLKLKVKKAVSYINRYEEVVANYAYKKNMHGVVCGHIHHASDKIIGDVHYYNDGDWVENCSALVEHFDGKLELIYWKDIIEKYKGSQLSPPDYLINSTNSF
jgi:UDP-2,3-diacylglucosamine pyrophosphatase LpxH